MLLKIPVRRTITKEKDFFSLLAIRMLDNAVIFLFILFYSILFYFILFYFIILYFILCGNNSSIEVSLDEPNVFEKVESG